MSTVATDDLKYRLKSLVKKVLGYSQPSSSVVLSENAPRKTVAALYLRGIEIGALHNPLAVPAAAHVKYVDRMAVSDLKQQYPELAELNLVEVDILDNGETLGTIPDASQDFVIANHFIEHCQDPIRTLENMLRVLKAQGVLYLGIPDKRFTFDQHRPITDLNHVLKDYHDGPEWSRKQHFREWAKFPFLGYQSDNDGQDDPRIEQEADRFMEMDYSIHFHAWTQTEIMELLVALKQKLSFSFDVELFLKNQDEMIVVLRKD